MLMKPKKRQKLCQNCEGEIDLDVIVCPFCAADLREEKPERQQYSAPSSVRNLNDGPSFESLYPSPHAPKAPPSMQPAEAQPQAAALESEEESKHSLTAIFVFSLGVQLCLLGLLTLIFSHHGVVVLKWSARFWFVYLFASLPLLVFGYKMLSKK
jgi:hypothetical protein